MHQLISKHYVMEIYSNCRSCRSSLGPVSLPTQYIYEYWHKLNSALHILLEDNIFMNSWKHGYRYLMGVDPFSNIYDVRIHRSLFSLLTYAISPHISTHSRVPLCLCKSTVQTINTALPLHWPVSRNGLCDHYRNTRIEWLTLIHLFI